nr:hypothetical protein CFP56_52779 [Quercus suber]
MSLAGCRLLFRAGRRRSASSDVYVHNNQGLKQGYRMLSTSRISCYDRRWWCSRRVSGIWFVVGCYGKLRGPTSKSQSQSA